MSTLQIASFEHDITPPLGHPLCAGWCPPATEVSERLTARGLILSSRGELPVVLCSLDWAELSNTEHLLWREALAAAVVTESDRVVVHCTHCHDAPWPDGGAQALLDESGHDRVIMWRDWCQEIRAAVAGAASRSGEGQPVDAVRVGQAKIEGLASNRRARHEDGTLAGVRWTRCRDAALRDKPEGLIDPWLRTVSFWRGGNKAAALHFYAVHPTSYDGTGIVTTDFPGIARERLIREEGGVPHLYFTGCAGNITAGKYNDGETDNRRLFAGKIHHAMREAEEGSRTIDASRWRWRSAGVTLPSRRDRSDQELRTLMEVAATPAQASRLALELAYRQRIDTPIVLNALELGSEAVLVFLPGEAFIEYQLFAQELRRDTWVAVAAYGDLGPGYICLEASEGEGGYEPKDAFCAPESESPLKEAISELLRL